MEGQTLLEQSAATGDSYHLAGVEQDVVAVEFVAAVVVVAAAAVQTTIVDEHDAWLSFQQPEVVPNGTVAFPQ